jgi:hypothetical protein
MTEDPFQTQTTASTSATNPALSDLEVLLGRWQVEMRFPTDPPTRVLTSSTVSWHEDGAFLKMHNGIETPESPWSTSIVSRDETTQTYCMLYYDWRGTSRIYQMSLEHGQWKQWRQAPGFSQRFIGTFSEDGRTITARWELSSDGEQWERDFDLTYTRVS